MGISQIEKTNVLKHFFLLRPYLQNRFRTTFFEAIIAFTPNIVLLRKTHVLGPKKQTVVLSIYSASGGVLPGGGVGPPDIEILM